MNSTSPTGSTTYLATSNFLVTAAPNKLYGVLRDTSSDFPSTYTDNWELFSDVSFPMYFANACRLFRAQLNEIENRKVSISSDSEKRFICMAESLVQARLYLDTISNN